MQDIYEEKNEASLEDYEIVYQFCDHPILVTAPHYHNVIEIIYILEGKMLVTVGDTAYNLGEGEMVLVNAREAHSVHVLERGMHRSVAVKFLPETISSDSQSLMELEYVIPYIMSFSNFKTHYTKEETENSDIKDCIDNIMKEDRERGYAYKFATKIFISQLFLDLIRRNNISLPNEDDLKENVRKEFASILHYISQHYNEKLTAPEIAKKFYLRQSDFSAHFKRITKKSFKEYLNYVRICKAKKLLINSQKNISEIAFAVGFTSTSYFIKSFKEQVGTAPATFKHLYTDPPASVYYNLEQATEVLKPED